MKLNKMIPILVAVLLIAVSCTPVPTSVIWDDEIIERADTAYRIMNGISRNDADSYSVKSTGELSNGTTVTEEYTYENSERRTRRTISNSHHTLVESFNGYHITAISIDGMSVSSTDAYERLRNNMLYAELSRLDIICVISQDGVDLDMTLSGRSHLNSSWRNDQKISIVMTDGNFSGGFTLWHDSNNVESFLVGGYKIYLEDEGYREAQNLWNRADSIIMDFWEADI